jgi:hypothetical protein
MRLDEVLLLSYIFSLPFNEIEHLKFSVHAMGATIVVTISDVFLLAAFYVVLLKRFILGSRISFLPGKLYFVFILAFIFSCINFTYIPQYSIAHDMKMKFNILQNLMLFYIFSCVVRNTAVLRRILLALCLCAFFVSSLTILKSLGINVIGHERTTYFRFGPFFIGAIALFEGMMSFATVVLGAIPATMQDIVIKRRWLRVILFFIFELSVFISFSRNLWVAAAAQVFFFYTCFPVHGEPWAEGLP